MDPLPVSGGGDLALVAADACSPSLERDKGGNRAAKQEEITFERGEGEGGIERYIEIKRDAAGEVEG